MFHVATELISFFCLHPVLNSTIPLHPFQSSSWRCPSTMKQKQEHRHWYSSFVASTIQLRSTAPSHLHRLMQDDPISNIYLPPLSELDLLGRSLTILDYSHLHHPSSLFLIERLTRNRQGETCGAVILRLTNRHLDWLFCGCLWAERWRVSEVVAMF